MVPEAPLRAAARLSSEETSLRVLEVCDVTPSVGTDGLGVFGSIVASQRIKVDRAHPAQR